MNASRVTKIVAVLVLILFVGQCAYSQVTIKKGFKGGLEYPTGSWADPGSFRNLTGFSFGLFTAVPLLNNRDNMLALHLELNFTRYYRYWVHHDFLFSYEYLLSRYVLDEGFRFSFLELALLPQYSYCFDDHITIALYAGPSVGVGSALLNIKYLFRTTVDTISFSGEMYPPYGEYNMDSGGRTATCLNIGISLYWSILVFDFRYKYTYFHHQSTEINNFRGFYGQLGLAF